MKRLSLLLAVLILALPLRAQSGSGYQVNLTWTAPTESADPIVGYDVYRAASGSSSYTQLNTAPVPAATGAAPFVDANVALGMTYTYYVTSVDGSGNQSAPSNLFSVMIPTAASALKPPGLSGSVVKSPTS